MVIPRKLYIPKRGDIVKIRFDPTEGSEQRGTRPALVVSPEKYSKKTSLALFVPITQQQKGYPYEVPLPAGLKTNGVILVDQIKCLDWKARGVTFFESAPVDVIEEVQAKIETLIF